MRENTVSGTTICNNCGAKLNPGAKFCNTCGQKVIPAAPALKCPVCRETVNENTKFCRHCGAELKPAIQETGIPVSPKPIQTETKKKDNSKTLIGIMAGVIVLLAIVIAFLLGRGSAAAPSAAVTADPELSSETNPEVTPEAVTRLDLTEALNDINEMQRVLPAAGGMETEEYANWWYSEYNTFAYACRSRSDAVDYFHSTEEGHSVFGMTIGEPVNTSDLSGWDGIGSNDGAMTYRLNDQVLTFRYETDSGKETVTELEFIREYNEETVPETVSEEDDYFFPDSLDVLLDESQLYGMSARELTLARNEVYARYGYTFQRQDLQEYFNTKSWYHADPKVNKDTISSYVSAIGMKNMVMIRDYQKAHGLTY